MKRCPNCQQSYPDNAPDFCPNDGTSLITNAPPQYNAPSGGVQQPYGTPPQQNWPPPQNWNPVGGSHPQAGYAPYTPRAAGGGGLAKAAMFCGLASLLLTAFFFFIIVMVREGNFDLVNFIRPSYYSMVAMGIIGLVLGIIALIKAGTGKGKAIAGICMSLPALLFFAYVVATTGEIG